MRCQSCGYSIEANMAGCQSADGSSILYNNVGKRRHGIPPSLCLACKKKTKSWEYKFCSHKCFLDYRWQITKRTMEANNEAILDKHGMATRKTKRYIRERDGCQCSICHTKKWLEQPIPLILDHIDGNPYNNCLDNLRLVCGNCDMLLPTFAGRNKGSGRLYRKLRDRKDAKRMAP